MSATSETLALLLLIVAASVLLGIWVGARVMAWQLGGQHRALQERTERLEAANERRKHNGNLTNGRSG